MSNITHVFNTETQFVQECFSELGFDNKAWAELSGSEQADMIAYMRKRRQHVYIMDYV